ncbi:ABC transporter permease [Streptomyces sp. A7024]|uniref:ABC transporter permease n=1 Tax=Streptomyces coryli TaxID=1128680 RepID=A0A6G4U7P6_9ACTN|nr:ABC transporter permease [Streptomyces coryli]NGN68022.1 ABC transporter permease [Streptomyces coryli]
MAQWVRIRLRTAPGAALALGVLVLVTAFLAAALPQGIDAYETRGLRHRIEGARAADRTISATLRARSHPVPPEELEQTFDPKRIAAGQRDFRSRLRPPLRTDAAQGSYGARSIPMSATDSYLPALGGGRPRFRLTAQAGLADHGRVVAGRLPRAPEGSPPAGGWERVNRLEAAVSQATAKTLNLRAGSVLHLPVGLRTLRVEVTGVMRAERPGGGWWSTEPLLLKPGVQYTRGNAPEPFWAAALLLPPATGPALLHMTGTEPETYWQLPLDSSGMSARDVPAVREQLASLENGPGLVQLQYELGEFSTVDAPVRDELERYEGLRGAIAPVVAVAGTGIAAVAAAVLLLAGGLAAARRRSELALLRARGGSLPGIMGRLALECGVVAVPAAVLGGAVAVAVTAATGPGGARLWPAVMAVGAVAVLATLALPVRAVFADGGALRKARPAPVRGEDSGAARPGRRRLVAEGTVLVLAAGAAVALRRRGTTASPGDVDLLVSAAPVLVAVIAALVFVRLYPLPLRLLARPAARLRGPVGFLSLARAGRAGTTAALPLLALIVALSTAAFGGSVTAAVDSARERAALLDVGADARISSARPLPDGAAERVRGVPGVGAAVPVWSDPGAKAGERQATLIAVEPRAYARLAERMGLGAAETGRWARQAAAGPHPDAPLPALVSPALAASAGSGGTLTVTPQHGPVRLRAIAAAEATPACPDCRYAIVPARDLAAAQPRAQRQPTSLLLAAARTDGTGIDAAALRAAAGRDTDTAVRAEVRDRLADDPMQTGAERLYLAAVAAGAGYALIAIVLGLLAAAPERTALLARLRTLGLGPRQARRLLVLESLPQALLAAAGGVLAGAAAIRLLAPGIDVSSLALAFRAGRTADVLGRAQLAPDPLSLTLPAGAVLLLALAAVLGQSWWTGRSREANELRAGDPA